MPKADGITPTVAERVADAETALEVLVCDREDARTQMVDAVANLMHWYKAHGGNVHEDWYSISRVAIVHFDDEQAGL